MKQSQTFICKIYVAIQIKNIIQFQKIKNAGGTMV
jgi:hypothetical protein